ncbi:MAG TPA: patatin-like phospholipase family protein, partial [Brumimicrobium sp.]|nr:patatin-like phospholipase family protein [Brumimicrobium sp.]
MKHKFVLFLFIIVLLGPKSSISQKVGLVLSGGGATGLAHIGVLQALEEAEIPIDYITGASMGSLIGALYAVGYSPEEIKTYILNSGFDKMASNEQPKEERYLVREKDKDASMINFKLAKDSLFYKSLPTNFTTPSALDLDALLALGTPSASLHKDFDSLFVPFRCVAADIYKKESVVFRKGDLNAAVRASMTYPFYVNAIRIDGNLLFDGGLYNNFPSDVIYQDFLVDYIIGSNVSSNDGPPSEDNILSQLSTMFVQETNFDLPCEYGVLIEPNSEVGTFEFARAEEAIAAGYQKGLMYVDSIRKYVKKRITKEELSEKRKAFKNKITPINITEIDVQSFANKNVSFIERNFMKDTLIEAIDQEELGKKYFKTYATPQVRYLYPTVTKNSDSTYKLRLEVTKQRPFALNIGGHFSTRAVSTTYIGASYYDIGEGAIGLHAESYFGRFYTSIKTKLDYDFPSLFPIRISPYFVLNRWDYNRSSSSFFQDSDPSFLLQNEFYYGVDFAIPASNNGKSTLGVRKFDNKDQYYQTIDYSKSDTADITFFSGETAFLEFEYNTLNRKQWASEGSRFIANIRYVQGKEKSISGTTPLTEYDLRRHHRWLSFSLEGQKYFKINSFFKVGLYGKATANSQSLFANYTATAL